MGRRARFLTALGAVGAVATSLVGALASPAVAGFDHSSWFMRSEPMDYVGRGQTWSYTEDDALITAEGDAHQVTLTLSRYDGRVWSARLAAPVGGALVSGTTYPAERIPEPTPTTATMDVSGNGRGCNSGGGEFTVDEASYDDSGVVDRFAVRFEQHCDGDEAALLGTIAWQASEPAVPLPPAPAEPVTRLDATAGLELGHLRWRNPGEDRFVTTVVRLSNTLEPPATIHDGRRVYSGRGEHLLLRELWQTSDYSVSVFTRGPDGSVAGPVSTRLRGTTLSLVERPALGYSKNLVIRLTDLAGRGVRDAQVTLYERRPGSDTWRAASGWETNRRGRAVRDWVNFRTRAYRAVFSGMGRHLGSISSEILVRGEGRPASR